MNNPLHSASNKARSAAHSAKAHAPKWIETFARVGIAAKGVVYVLVGVLAAMTVFGQGGQTEGKRGALDFLMEQSYGKILVGVVVVGLFCYVAWRMIQAFKNPENKETASRVGYFFSGLTYLFFAISGIRMMSSGGSGSSGGGRETLVAKLLDQPFGQVLVGIFAAIVVGKGVYQFYRGFSGKFKDGVKQSEMSKEEESVFMRAGRVGYLARGVVLGIVGYFLVKAALNSNASQAGGTGKAFDFLSSTGGPYLLAAVAIGLACYGIFMFVKSRYRYIPTVSV